MKKIGAFEAKTHFSQIIEQIIQTRAPIVIQRRGKDVAAIYPTSSEGVRVSSSDVNALIGSFRSLRAAPTRGKRGTRDSMSTLVRAGRKW